MKTGAHVFLSYVAQFFLGCNGEVIDVIMVMRPRNLSATQMGEKLT